MAETVCGYTARCGQAILSEKRHCERHVQELIEKTPLMPADMRWHFIGHLQSNKVKALLEGCPNLAMLETVDSVKLANKLNNAVESCGRQPLEVLIQVLPLSCDVANW